MQKMRSDAEKIYTQAIQTSLPDEAIKKAVAGRNFAFQGKVVIIAVMMTGTAILKLAVHMIFMERSPACCQTMRAGSLAVKVMVSVSGHRKGLMNYPSLHWIMIM